MPEYFLTCALFNAISDGRAITLETPFWQIHQWLGEGSHVPPDLDEGSGGWKVDMVIYDGGGKLPSAQKAWGFVEIKKGFIDADKIDGRRTDRDKLENIAKLFPDLRPKLICCGVVDAKHRKYHFEKATELHDGWFQAATGELPYGYEEQFFCARLLP
jgi:hypothetical protein